MGRELSLGYGIKKSFPRLGSAITSFATPRIYRNYGTFGAPALVGLGVATVSTGFGVLLYFLNKNLNNDQYNPLKGEGVVVDNTEVKACSCACKKEKTDWKEIFIMPIQVYLISILCMLILGSFYAIIANLNDMIHSVFLISNVNAGSLIMIVYISGTIFSPLVGIFVDKIGNRELLMIISSIFYFFTSIFILFFGKHTNISFIVLYLFMLGLVFSTYAAIFWPSVAIYMPKKLAGTALGFATGLQNLGLFYNPLVYGTLTEKTHSIRKGYFWNQIFISSEIVLVFIIILILTAIIYYQNKKQKNDKFFELKEEI